MTYQSLSTVIPAKAGIQESRQTPKKKHQGTKRQPEFWIKVVPWCFKSSIPAFAGMTR
jgi:hypothetical protein